MSLCWPAGASARRPAPRRALSRWRLAAARDGAVLLALLYVMLVTPLKSLDEIHRLGCWFGLVALSLDARRKPGRKPAPASAVAAHGLLNRWPSSCPSTLLIAGAH